MNDKDIEFPVKRLSYPRGDLIMKEGDYGISIYRVKKGRVQVTRRQGETDVTLTTLGPGEIFGEMSFLNKALETRSASVRALEDVELEVMHPRALSREYEGMPPILRYITSQTLTRLARLNKMYTKLLKNKEPAGTPAYKEPEAVKRRYYRKPLDETCIYRPLRGFRRLSFEGRVTDISVGGAALEVNSGNALKTPHTPGEELSIHIRLPNGREIEPVGVIRMASKAGVPGSLRLGVEFTEFKGEDRKTLGFFMMS
jgi:CRP-like cAMP-binding protein